jgi:hypothetical protein
LLVLDSILKELTERSRCSRSARSRRAPRFKAQMSHEGSARQLQRSPPLVAPLLRCARHGPGRVDESDVTDREIHNPVVLNDSGVAIYLK